MIAGDGDRQYLTALGASQLTDIIDLMPEAVLAIDLEGRVIIWNKAMEALTGINAEEMLGKGDYEYAIPFYGTRRPMLVDLAINPDTEYESGYENLTKAGSALIGETFVPYFRKNGAHIQSKASPLQDSDGKVTGSIEYILDITLRKKAEEAYRALAGNSIQGLLVFQNNRAVFANEAYARMVGYTLKEIMTISQEEWQAIIHPDDRDMVCGCFNGCFAGKGVPDRCEFRAMRKDGSILWLEMNARLIEYQGGPAFQAAIIDISGRKRAEAELRHSLNRLSRIADNMLDMIAEVDAKGILKYVSPSQRSILGYELEELLGRSAFDFIHPCDLDRAIATFQRSIVTRFPEMEEYRCRCKDGRYIWLESIGNILYDGTGSVRGAVLSTRDITGRKMAEEALKVSESRYKTIFENCGNAMVILERDMTIALANAMAGMLFCCDGGEITGKSLIEHICGGDREPLKSYLSEIGTSADQRGYEFQMVDEAGGIRHVFMTAAAIPGSDQIIASLLDITENRKNEERLSKLTESFLCFGPEPEENISRLVALCGEQLGAASALYSRLEGDTLHPMGHWNLLPGFEYGGEAEGQVCHDLIKYGRESISVIRDLQRTAYAHTDPNVKRYGLKTCIGKAVSLGGDHIGSLCTVYQNDCILSREDERLLCIIASAIGVEEMRRRAKEALRESEEYLNKIINSIGDPVFVKDRLHRVVLANEAACKLFGRPSDEIIGKTAYELFPTEEMARISWEKDEEVFRTGIENVNEETNIYAPGTARTVLVKKSLYTDNAGNQFVVGITRDITDRKRAEDRLAKSLKEKDVLLREVHHRVKNNLQIVSSLLNIQADHARDKQTKTALKESQDRIRSMALVHEALYSSEDLAMIDLPEYVTKLATYLARSYGVERQISLRLNLEDASLGIDKAIPFGLIINELLTNSIKHAFSKDRDGEICIDLNSVEDIMVLVVGDDGIGMPEGFDIQATKSMGLILISSLVKQLRGTVDVDGRCGTRFRIAFPA